jgi:hypothetical protein
VVFITFFFRSQFSRFSSCKKCSFFGLLQLFFGGKTSLLFSKGQLCGFFG